MKYARENYKGPCAYRDVGKVVSRIVSDECTSRFGMWCKATNKLKIRLRVNDNKHSTTIYWQKINMDY